MLILRDLSLQRGGKLLFAGISLTVNAGQKVGVIGANGTGKSTLFALLQGELYQDRGDLEWPSHWTVAHVAQETPSLPVSAIDYVLDGDVEWRQIETQLKATEAIHDGSQLAELHAHFEAIGGYTAKPRAAQLLAGLGFAAEQLQQPVAELSGGWRVRLNLARALMCRSDLLLLDEPTNHLDLDAVLWLEQWLRSYPGTLLLISHDRDFLDNVVTHIAHLENRQIRLYSGNYLAFESQRAARLVLQQAIYQKQRREIARLGRFIDRFRAKASKARQVQSRLRALERMERVAAAHLDSPFHFSFPEPEKLPNPLLVLDKVTTGYGDRKILEGVSLAIGPGTRLGLLGSNGAGKTTLIKLLAGELPPLSGRLERRRGLVIGYFAQHQLEQLQFDWSPLQHLQYLDPKANEQELRDFLGSFGFTGDQALAPVMPFSGGEKARLVLALLVWRRPNLLLLDEPSNHLDLEMRHALTVALQQYQGALIVVSHDRYLLRTTTDAFTLVANGRVQPFDGDLEDYRVCLNACEYSLKETAERRAEPSRREQRRLEAERRNRLTEKRRPLERQVKAVELRMKQLSAAKAEIAIALTAQGTYEEANKAKLKELLLHQARTDRELAEVEEEWLNLQEQLEAAVKG
jgi:ATP-binding cassette subfamily F protein 3